MEPNEAVGSQWTRLSVSGNEENAGNSLKLPCVTSIRTATARAGTTSNPPLYSNIVAPSRCCTVHWKQSGGGLGLATKTPVRQKGRPGHAKEVKARKAQPAPRFRSIRALDRQRRVPFGLVKRIACRLACHFNLPGHVPRRIDREACAATDVIIIKEWCLFSSCSSQPHLEPRWTDLGMQRGAAYDRNDRCICELREAGHGIQALTNAYPRSCARFTATIPAGTRRELATKLVLNSLNTLSAFPPDAAASGSAICLVAISHTANCTPRLMSVSMVALLLGSPESGRL